MACEGVTVFAVDILIVYNAALALGCNFGIALFACVRTDNVDGCVYVVCHVRLCSMLHAFRDVSLTLNCILNSLAPSKSVARYSLKHIYNLNRMQVDFPY